MTLTLQKQRQTSQIGDEPELNDVSTPLSPITRVMTAVVILRLSVFAALVLTGVLVYAVVNAALRGLILVLAVAALLWGLLLYQVISMICLCGDKRGSASVAPDLSGRIH